MHLRGKAFELERTHIALLSVPHYDFNWQHWYAFAESLPLDCDDSLSMTVTFDNSVNNIANPAPEDYVTWGDQTFEEMAIAFFDIAQPLGISNASPPNCRRSICRRRTEKQFAARVQQYLLEHDADGSGAIERQETPLSMQRFGFRTGPQQ